jgi:hypothetical protein
MIVLVAGPPCAGKTTYVQVHAAPGDEVVDYDALSGPDAPQRWRRMVDAPLGEGRTRWVIWTAPRRQDRGRFRSMHHAEVIVVWAPEHVCMERARSERPSRWVEDYVPAWFRAWQPSRTAGERIVLGTEGYSEAVDGRAGVAEMGPA